MDSPPIVSRIRELPTAQVVGPGTTRRPTRKAILGNHFYVYGQTAQLTPPIDWRQDPHESRTWCYELHTLTWLKEALVRHAAGGDVETLAVARDIVLDWARSNVDFDAGEEQHDSDDASDLSEFAWYDMAVGLRAPYVAYVVRTCMAEEMLDEEAAALLLEAAQRHGAFLACGENYATANNHGLFEDEGLYLLARLLPELPAAEAWRDLALVRIKSTLKATVSREDGAHLEHSPAYQLAILDLVARLATNVSELPELGPLLERMRRTAAWQTTPAGRMVQLGDTDSSPAPRWARDTAKSLRGMNVLTEAGQIYVREGDSYLAVSAAHHGAAHRHSDDTGFVLVEGGQTILGDAGRWGYYEQEPDRIYARSAAAHNVLTVDDEDFDWRGTEPYGSGLVAAREDGGWYSIVIRNPLLASQGVDHRRVLLYCPGEALLVFDGVRSPKEHEYTRHFHFGGNLEAERIGKGQVSLTGEGVVATLTDIESGANLSLDRGGEGPRVGWAYPGDREREPVWTARLRSRASHINFTTVLSFGEDPTPVDPVKLDHGLSLLS